MVMPALSIHDHRGALLGLDSSCTIVKLCIKLNNVEPSHPSAPVGQQWTSSGPGVDQQWTNSRPAVAQQWTGSGPAVDQQWTSSGPAADQQWTGSGKDAAEATGASLGSSPSALTRLFSVTPDGRVILEGLEKCILACQERVDELAKMWLAPPWNIAMEAVDAGNGGFEPEITQAVTDAATRVTKKEKEGKANGNSKDDWHERNVMEVGG